MVELVILFRIYKQCINYHYMDNRELGIKLLQAEDWHLL